MTYLVFKGYGLYGEEASYGASATCSSQFGYLDSIRYEERNNILRKRSIGGGRNFVKGYLGKYECSGDLDISLTTGAPFRLLLGGTDTGTNPHSIAEADIVPSFALEVGYKDGTTANDKVFKWQGIKANTFATSMTRETTEAKVTINAFGQKPIVSTTSQSPTVTTAEIFRFYHGAAYMAGSTTADTELVSADVTISNGLQPRTYLGGRFYGNIFEGVRNYDIVETLNFKNMNEWGRFFDGTTSSVQPSTNGYTEFGTEFKLTNGSNYIDLTFATTLWDTVGSPIPSAEDSEVIQRVVGVGKSVVFTYI